MRRTRVQCLYSIDPVDDIDPAVPVSDTTNTTNTTNTSYIGGTTYYNDGTQPRQHSDGTDPGGRNNPYRI